MEFDIAYLRETLVSLQVCVDQPQEVVKAHEAQFNAQLKPSGTTYGWQIDFTVAPVQCANNPNRWHYICKCF